MFAYVPEGLQHYGSQFPNRFQSDALQLVVTHRCALNDSHRI